MQKLTLIDLGVAEDRIYIDQGLTGTNRMRPGLDQANAGAREGGIHWSCLKLDRLARSVPDARAIADQLEVKGVKLGLVHQSTTQQIQWVNCFSTSLLLLQNLYQT